MSGLNAVLPSMHARFGAATLLPFSKNWFTRSIRCAITAAACGVLPMPEVV